MQIDHAVAFKKINKCINKSNMTQLSNIIEDANNYNTTADDLMWKEQTYINFPILYLASMYLYEYATSKGCNIFLFATRDCSYWHKIFAKMYPQAIVHYFNCSRVMLEKATDDKNKHYNKYVKGMVSKENIKRTIYVDVHGTGERILKYFQVNFGKIPRCFLLSASAHNYKELLTKNSHKRAKKKLHCLIYNARGSPIEMLNYDVVGTLYDFDKHGPIRSKLEYDEKFITPYKITIDYMVDNLIQPVDTKVETPTRIILKLLKKIFKFILDDKPVIANYIRHIGTHPTK